MTGKNRTSPRVSVLMTVYNREDFIAEAIESVLKSTFQDWELIIVDDRSTDRSFDIASVYAENDDRIRVFLNEKNLGDYPNRNMAASFAVGEYLKYLDSDDLIYPHGLEVMVQAMDAYREAALGTQLTIREDAQPYPYILSQYEVFKRHFLEGGLLFSGPTGVIIRRSVFKELGGFAEERHVGDSELWFRLANEAPVVCFQPALIWWRTHEGQEMMKEKLNPEIFKIRFRLNVETIQSNEFLNEKEKRFALYIQRRFYARKILYMALKGNAGTAISLFNEKNFRLKDLFKAFRLKSAYK